MPTPESLGMLALGELVWPVTWRFRVWTPNGETQQTLTCDVPELTGQHDPSRDLGALLWQRSLAVASVGDVQLLGWDTMLWRGGLGSIPMIASQGGGVQSGVGSRREDAGQLVFHTGHMDRWARRAVPLPCMPRSWVSERQLSSIGWTALRTIAEAMNIALQAWDGSGHYQLLLAYPEVVERDILNPVGVAFRRVTHIRVCQFTDRAPDPSQDWI